MRLIANLMTKFGCVSIPGLCTADFLHKLFLLIVGGLGTAAPNSATGSQRGHYQHSKYQTPAAALYETTENTGSAYALSQTSGRYGIFNHVFVLMLNKSD